MDPVIPHSLHDLIPFVPVKDMLALLKAQEVMLFQLEIFVDRKLAKLLGIGTKTQIAMVREERCIL
jgi:hypothetical protein